MAGTQQDADVCNAVALLLPRPNCSLQGWHGADVRKRAGKHPMPHRFIRLMRASVVGAMER